VGSACSHDAYLLDMCIPGRPLFKCICAVGELTFFIAVISDGGEEGRWAAGRLPEQLAVLRCCPKSLCERGKQ